MVAPAATLLLVGDARVFVGMLSLQIDVGGCALTGCGGFFAHCRRKENTDVSAGWAIRRLLVSAVGGSCASATPRKVGRAVAGVGWCSPCGGHVGDPLPVQAPPQQDVPCWR
ncbi:hypothetical protein [Rhodococcus erythropolis]|uniref:hypothetical protein n=1 Tax=Rhodococcus erythropolis TaxID=1833 RepID=UPI001BE7725D|nr:hypothetical protein [Rhodococcus erythropolis]MBT2269669.1 hypothetical protein [Rhodococcus erythropolis]